MKNTTLFSVRAVFCTVYSHIKEYFYLSADFALSRKNLFMLNLDYFKYLLTTMHALFIPLSKSLPYSEPHARSRFSP